MNKYEKFDKYFQYSYFDENDKKIGVFLKDTPKGLIEEAKDMFDIVEFE